MLYYPSYMRNYAKSKQHVGLSPVGGAAAAFSLVELSIVLVIIGLLAGGVLSGQSLIRASQLRTVITQYEQYKTAISTFRDKYFALPGDMSNAVDFWGPADATPACWTTPSTSKATCNGDGNGLISDGNGNPATGGIAGSPTSNEAFRAWQHLANAGLIEGQYDGVSHLTTIHGATEENSPVGKLANTLWYVGYWSPVSGGGLDRFDGEYGRYFQFGTKTAAQSASGPTLKPEEMWNLDKKIDDGKPGTGFIVPRKLLDQCTMTSVGGADLAVEYRLSNQNVVCAVIFRQL